MGSKKWYDELRKGDQASHLYNSAAERSKVITDLIAWMEREKFILLSDHDEDLASSVTHRIISAALEDGRLEVLPGRLTVAPTGPLKAEGMASAIDGQLIKARDDGYDGLVMVWDLSWLAGEPADFEAFLGHQSLLALRPLPTELTIMGQYDLSGFGAQQVERILRVSPLVLEGGELRRNFWVVSNTTMGRPPRPGGFPKRAAPASEA